MADPDINALIDALFEADDYIIRPCHKCCKCKPFEEANGKLLMCSSCGKWYFDNQPVAAPNRRPFAAQ